MPIYSVPSFNSWHFFCPHCSSCIIQAFSIFQIYLPCSQEKYQAFLVSVLKSGEKLKEDTWNSFWYCLIVPIPELFLWLSSATCILFMLIFLKELLKKQELYKTNLFQRSFEILPILLSSRIFVWGILFQLYLQVLSAPLVPLINTTPPKSQWGKLHLTCIICSKAVGS